MLIEYIKSKIKARMFKKNAIKELWLTEDNSNRREKVEYDEIYVIREDFYENQVRGFEEFISKWLQYKSIAVLYTATRDEEINFIHNTYALSEKAPVVDSILKEGIRYSEECTVPLGKGIYVWKMDEHIVRTPSQISFAINNYEGQYLKLVHYEGGKPLSTEYLLLKLREKNVAKMW